MHVQNVEKIIHAAVLAGALYWYEVQDRRTRAMKLEECAPVGLAERVRSFITDRNLAGNGVTMRQVVRHLWDWAAQSEWRKHACKLLVVHVKYANVRRYNM